jgi:hypothetical protein
MIRKVLAIAVSIQLIMPLSLMASVQSAAPTKQDVEVLLDKPQQNIKNLGIGAILGAGATAFSVYVAYTAIRISKLSGKNKELSKEIASLSTRLEQASTDIASNASLSAKHGKAIASTNKRITNNSAENGRQILALQKENASLTKKLADSDAALRLLEEGQENFSKVLNQHANIINKNTQGINAAFANLEAQAQAINNNAAMTQEFINKQAKPRPVTGFAPSQSKVPTLAPAAEDAYLGAVQAVSKDIASGGKRFGALLGKAKFLMRKNAGKMSIAGIAVFITVSLLPQTVQAARISQTRLSYTRALAAAKTSNPDYYVITALELAKYNKPLVAAIIAEQAQTDAALYPAFKAQIEDISSSQTLTLAARISQDVSYYGMAQNKANLLAEIKK